MEGPYGRGLDRSYGNRGYDRGGYGATGYGSTGYGPSTTYTYSEYWLIPGPMSGQGPEGYQRSGDQLRGDVCERMTSHGRLDASSIQVNVDGDEVTLEGTVRSRRDKREAENVAESGSGVRDVHNRLRIEGDEGGTGNEMGSSRSTSSRATSGTSSRTKAKTNTGETGTTS